MVCAKTVKIKTVIFYKQRNNDVISSSGSRAQSQMEELASLPRLTCIDQLFRQNKFRQSKKYLVLAVNRPNFLVYGSTGGYLHSVLLATHNTTW